MVKPLAPDSTDNGQASNGNNNASFASRFEDEFQILGCLGKGAFGVVFEVKCKLDDWHYAIKRIKLPRNEDALKRVSREVTALASLNHVNIVRYNSSWIETPPAGWQEERDRINEDQHGFSFSFSLGLLEEAGNRCAEGALRKYLYIATELCKDETLAHWLSKNKAKRVRKSNATRYFKSILSAAVYIHSKSLIHRDLKVHTVLYNFFFIFIILFLVSIICFVDIFSRGIFSSHWKT